MLDVIKGTPRYKKSKYPLAVNLAVLGMIFLRCVSVAYFVMGLVWKLHTGVIDESWISILNRLWIGHLRLGSTVNGLVLTSICLFPFYIISGCMGLLGMFCRKSLFVALYMSSLVVFVLVDVIFISMFIFLSNGIGGSLATDFQNIYLQITRTSWSNNYNDLKNSNQEWIAMFSTLGCCGITDRFITPGYTECHNYHYTFNYAEICWGKFAEAMGSYLTTFACFAAICLVIETVQLGVVDFIYSQMTNKRFPFALIRTLVSMVKKSPLARDRMLIVANILRILSCISGLSLVVLGTMILTDTKLTGQEVKGIFVFIYILGVNFRNIIEGFGIAMIVLGSIAFVLNSVAIISDVIVPSKTKSKLITFLKVIMLIAEVTVLGIVVRFATQVNTDLRYKMANLLRNFNYLNRPWRIFFGELECCGVASSNDLCDMISGNTYCSNTLPYTCCHRSLYDTTESNIYSNSGCSNPNTPCLDLILSQLRIYSTGFFIGVSFSVVFGILCIIFTILHTRRLNSQVSNDKKGDNFKDELVESMQRSSCKNVLHTILTLIYSKGVFIISIILLLFSVGFFIEGFFLLYDNIFDHEIIKDVLWSALTFDGLSFNHIRESLSFFMISSSLVILFVACIGFFTLRTNSKCLHVFQIILTAICCLLVVVGTGLWGKAKDSISYKLEYEMSVFLQRFGYHAALSYLFTNSAYGAWSHLFAVAECCGIYSYAYGELSQYVSPNQIPIFCCKENPLTEPYSETNVTCTNLQQWDLNHGSTCKDVVLTRLDKYSNAFIAMSVLTIVCFIAQISLIIYKLRKTELIPLINDKYVQALKNLFKMEKGLRNVFVFEKKMIFPSITMLSALAMLILGIVMKHDDKMTGENVYNVYALLYFKGVNFTDIVEAMYLIFIVVGTLSAILSLVKLSHVFKSLQSKWKNKWYIGCLLILIITKLICISLMIPIRIDIDANAPYQLTNMDRQYRNNQNWELPGFLNRFYFTFDCCGADGPYEFSYLEGTDGYSGRTGAQPYVCCYGGSHLDERSLLSSINCEKKSCTPEFLDSFDSYSDAFLAIFSITAVLEIVCFVIEAKSIASDLKSKFKQQFVLSSNEHRKKIRIGIIASGVIMLVAVGLIAEGAALRYDAVFSHKQIDLIFSAMSMVHQSFSTNLLIWRWLMVVSGILLVLGSFSTMLLIRRKSKFLHLLALVFHIFCVTLLVSAVGWWIAVYVEGFPDVWSFYYPFNIYSYLVSGYGFTINDAWNSLFVTLECCGYHSGIYFDFWTTQFQSTSGSFTPSIFCCHSNPLTKTYNYNTGCTTDTSSRYTEACRDKLSQRLLTYSIFFYVMMSVCLILEVLLIVLLGILLKYDEPFSTDNILKNMCVQQRKKNKVDSNKETENSIIQQKEEKLTEDKNHSIQKRDINSRIRENKVRPMSTESQVKVENNGKDSISPNKQKNENLADSPEHSTETTNATNRKKNKISPLSPHPRDIHERSTYSEGEKKITNNDKERSLNKQPNVNKDESQKNLESTGENHIKWNNDNDRGKSPVQQKDESLVDGLENSIFTDENNVIGANENKNNPLSSEGKQELTNNTEEKSLDEQQRWDNLESHENFESTGENRIKTNKNNDKGNISPVLQKDESLVGGLDYSTSTDENNVIRKSENNSLSSEGKKELTSNTEESSLNKQQNEDDVENHANFELTEENRIQTNKNNDAGNISPVQHKDETLADDLEYSTSTDENSVIRTSQNNLLSSEGNKELINNTEENSLIKQ